MLVFKILSHTILYVYLINFYSLNLGTHIDTYHTHSQTYTHCTCKYINIQHAYIHIHTHTHTPYSFFNPTDLCSQYQVEEPIFFATCFSYSLPFFLLFFSFFLSSVLPSNLCLPPFFFYFFHLFLYFFVKEVIHNY